jgi:hypothetical protein
MLDHARTAERDERAVAVENESYRFGYLFTVYSLLIAVMYRSWAKADPAWDLLAIVILSGAVTTAYQLRHRILGPRSVRAVLVAVIGAAIVAAALVLLGRPS